MPYLEKKCKSCKYGKLVRHNNLVFCSFCGKEYGNAPVKRCPTVNRRTNKSKLQVAKRPAKVSRTKGHGRLHRIMRWFR